MGLTLIDLDDVCVTNINRQLPALTSTIGQLKTEVLAARVKDINPDCTINTIDDFLTVDNLTEYLAPPVTAVLDAIDSVPVKAALRSEEHTSELQSRPHLVCRLLLEKKK